MILDTSTPTEARDISSDARWSNIKNFANELSESRLREIKWAAANRWTPERRAQKADLVHQHKPFRHATGPKTGAGKSRSAMNAVKHNGYRAGMKEWHKLLGRQRRYVRMVMAEHELEKVRQTPAMCYNPPMETLDELFRRMRVALEIGKVENPALDARLIVQAGGAFSDADMISKGQTPLSRQQVLKTEQFLGRRLGGEPISRILGGREFWGLTFKLSPDTLDPRPDTETLVEAALNWARKQARKDFKILDLGTGTGAILISLLSELRDATGIGIDINSGAISIAKHNAAVLGVESRALFLEGSWFSPLDTGESFDLIVSNPPYIPRTDIESLAVEVRNHDPILALSGGEDGLEAYKIILKDLEKHLVRGGRALFEIGQGQEKDLARLAGESKMVVRDSHRDLAGILRVVEMSCGEK